MATPAHLEDRRSALTGHCYRMLGSVVEFFRKLGFDFNQQFTDDKAACMVLSEDAFVMLLTEPFFKTFTKNDVCDTRRETEGLFALSCEKPGEVDDLVKKAVAAGGAHAMNPMDQGFLYGWSLYDLDRHHWEVLWMDPAAIGQ